MTKEEQKKINKEMHEFAEQASFKVNALCAAITLPYKLQALKILRDEIDEQIGALEQCLVYAKNNSI